VIALSGFAGSFEHELPVLLHKHYRSIGQQAKTLADIHRDHDLTPCPNFYLSLVIHT